MTDDGHGRSPVKTYSRNMYVLQYNVVYEWLLTRLGSKTYFHMGTTGMQSCGFLNLEIELSECTTLQIFWVQNFYLEID